MKYTKNLDLNLKLRNSNIKEQLIEIYSRVNSEIPKKIEDLEKKYEFNSKNMDKEGRFGKYYELKKGLGGKVLYDKIGIKSSKIAFEKIRKEFINYKIGSELGISVPKNLDLVMALDNSIEEYFPMIVSQNLGKFEVNSLIMSNYERELSRENFEIEVKKLIPYLKNSGGIDLKRLGNNMTNDDRLENKVFGADICYNNSRWDRKNEKSYLIDSGRWKFKELDI